MLRLNKKPCIFGLFVVFCASFLFLSSSPAQALDTSVRQVKTNGSSAVYYLYHAGHRKKAYLNANTYLGYGNKWSDVKIVASSELNSWPDAKLLKKTGTPVVYYIKGSQKSTILSWTDLENFSLANEPIIIASQTDLDQYKDVSYNEIGLILPDSENPKTPMADATSTNATSTESTNVSADKLEVFTDLVTNANNNTLVAGSDDNLMGVFRFRASSVATVTAITFDFTGIYSNTLLGSAWVANQNGSKYDTSINVNQNLKQITIRFNTPLAFNKGEEKTVKLYLDVTACTDCNNQVMRAAIMSGANIKTNLTPTADFPLKGTEFKLIDASSIMGAIKSQEESIVKDNQGNTSGSRLIGKFTLSETTGREDVVIKEMVLRSGGTAAKNDLKSFTLYSNNQLISRVDAIDNNGNIDFKINYLRLTRDFPATITVRAVLGSAYSKEATVNLILDSLDAVGTIYKTFLSPEIINLNESIVLN